MPRLNAGYYCFHRAPRTPNNRGFVTPGRLIGVDRVTENGQGRHGHDGDLIEVEAAARVRKDCDTCNYLSSVLRC